jgi:uncharacterized membrane protein
VRSIVGTLVLILILVLLAIFGYWPPLWGFILTGIGIAAVIGFVVAMWRQNVIYERIDDEGVDDTVS